MAIIALRSTALTAEAFAPYGEVIETAGRASRWINGGTCRRFDEVADIDVLEAAGRPLLSIFEASPRALPLRIRSLERHPLSSQAFCPLQAEPFLVVVAADGAEPLPQRIRAYLSSAGQGVNYRRNTWHHPLIAIGRPSRFLVIDRGGPRQNCEELHVDADVILSDLPPTS